MSSQQRRISVVETNRRVSVALQNEKGFVKQKFSGLGYGKRAKHAAVVLENEKILIFGGQTDSNSVDRDLLLIENNYDILKQQTNSLEKSFSNSENPTSSTTTNPSNKISLSSPLVNWENQMNWFCSHPFVVNPEEAPPGLREHSMCIYRPNYVNTSHLPVAQQQQMIQEFGKEVIVIFGGKNDFYYFNDVFLLHTATWEWQKVVCQAQKKSTSSTTQPPQQRRLTVLQQEQQESLLPQDRNTRPSSASDWYFKTNESPQLLPAKRSNHTAVIRGHKMIIYGGLTSRFGQTTLGDLWEFNLQTHRWNSIQLRGGIVPPERHSHVACLLHDKLMLIFGGCHLANQKDKLSDCWIFDLDHHIWHEVRYQGIPPYPPRVDLACCLLGNSNFVLMHGGKAKNGKYLKDMYVLDMQKQAFVQLEMDRKNAPSARKSHTINYLPQSDRIVVLGGSSRKRGKLDDFYHCSATQLKETLLSENEFFAKKKQQINDLAQQVEDHSSVEYCTNKAQLLIDMREYRSAIDYLTRAMKQEESNEKVLALRAMVYFWIGDYNLALQDVIAAKSYKSIELQLLRVNCLINLGRYSDASTILESIDSTNCTDATSQQVLAIKLKLGDYEKQIEKQKKNDPKYKRIIASDADEWSPITESDYYLTDLNNDISKNYTPTLTNQKMIQVFLTGAKGSGVTSFLYNLRSIFVYSMSNLELKYFSKSIQKAAVVAVKLVLSCIADDIFDDSMKAIKQTISTCKQFSTREMIQALKSIGKEKAVKQFLSDPCQLLTSATCANVNVTYFVTHLERILSSDFVPTPLDVLHVWKKPDFRLPLKSHSFRDLLRMEKQSMADLEEDWKDENEEEPEEESVFVQPQQAEQELATAQQTEDNEDDATEDDLQTEHTATTAAWNIEQPFLDSPVRSPAKSPSIASDEMETIHLDLPQKPIPFRFHTPLSNKTPEQITSFLQQQDTHVYIQMVSLANFDQLESSASFEILRGVRVKYGSQSSVVKGLKEFRTFCNGNGLENIPLVIVFTHLDCLQQMIRANSNALQATFPDFNASKKDILQTCSTSGYKLATHLPTKETIKDPLRLSKEFIYQVFQQMNMHEKRVIVPFFVNTFSKRQTVELLKKITEVMGAMFTEQQLRYNSLL